MGTLTPLAGAADEGLLYMLSYCILPPLDLALTPAGVP